MSDPQLALVEHVAVTYGLQSDLLWGQVQVESGGDPFAFRYEHDFFLRYIAHNENAKAFKYGPLAACSYGLLQIIFEVACELGFDGRPEDLFVDRIGLAWGAKKLQALLTRANHDPVQMLCAYNGGQAGNELRPFRNMDYARKVYHAAGRPPPV